MSGGYKKYLINIIPRLASDSNIESLLCISPESLNVDKWFEPMRNVEFLSCAPFRPIGYKLGSEVLERLRRFSPDVIFIPIERPMKFYGVPIVTILQNMEPFVSGIPKYSLTERIRCWLQYMTGERAVKNAARVIAVSGFVRDFLINTWNISSDKIGLVNYGLAFEKNAAPIKPGNIPPDWDKKFIFTAGSVRPARGLEDLILAAKNVNFDSLGIKGVVIAGIIAPNMLKYKQRLLNLIKDNDLTSRFIFLGEIDSLRMRWCYENCRVFIATSRVESFGMVGVEAMAHGCVCVVADNPCLPEIFRDCAVYYNPKDAIGLAGVISSVLTRKEDKRLEMSRKARERAGEFSWEKTAKELIKELKNAL